jgi:hypothetical protein
MERGQMRSIIAIASAAAGALTLPAALSAADTAAGAAAWVQEYPAADDAKPRSCSTCHGRDLTKPGRQASTGKVIEPMAPSVNPQRFTDTDKVEKWFRRNCNWVMQRACTPAEKVDFLSYLKAQ